MQQFNSPNVYYLENSDFDSNYRLVSNVFNPYTGHPFFSGLTIIMVQGNYCHYCTELKPKFQQVADNLSQQGIDFATIQIDSEQAGEQIFKTDALTYIIGKPLEGVPIVLKFYQGRVVDMYTGDHDANALAQWIMS
jgi:thiol-disulfide isomerase/thioredoxin